MYTTKSKIYHIILCTNACINLTLHMLHIVVYLNAVIYLFHLFLPSFSGDRRGSFAPRGSHNDHRGTPGALWTEPQCRQTRCRPQVASIVSVMLTFVVSKNEGCGFSD